MAVCIAGCQAAENIGAASPSATAPVTIRMASSYELEVLTKVVAELTGIPLALHPEAQRLATNLKLRLAVPTAATVTEVWAGYVQALAEIELAPVVTGDAVAYRVVPMKDAARFSKLLSETELSALPQLPGWIQVQVPLTQLGTEAAVTLLGPVMGGAAGAGIPGQSGGGIRSVGAGQRAVVLSGTRQSITTALRLLRQFDTAEAQPVVMAYRPANTSPQRMQGALVAAWATLQKHGSQAGLADALLSSDNSTLMLVGATAAVAQMRTLAQAIDIAEPVTTETYRPQRFPIADVATLIEQVIGSGGSDGSTLRVTRNQLTGSIIVRTTSAQHARIQELISQLEQSPEGSQRTLHTFPVRRRLASEVATTIQDLITAGGGSVSLSLGAPNPAAAVRSGEAAAITPANGLAQAPAPVTAPAPQPAFNTTRTTAGSTTPDSLFLTTDDKTNTILVLGTPRQVGEVKALLERLDRKIPQVELEVILVTLNDGQSQQFGVDLAALNNRSALTIKAGSLLGLFTKGVTPDSPTTSGVTLGVGDFAVTVRALEGLNIGRSVVRGRMVVDNGAKAALTAVLQQPIGSINTSGNNTSSTTFTGTSDAGTQVSITPQITAGDQITLTFSIQQSSFQGGSSADAPGLPPPKLQDSLAATTSIPDGHVVVLGGITNAGTNTTDTHVPYLGRIPLLGLLFGNTEKTTTDTRFLIFIRADVLRSADFEDLRRLSKPVVEGAGVTPEQPVVKPRFLEPHP